MFVAMVECAKHARPIRDFLEPRAVLRLAARKLAILRFRRALEHGSHPRRLLRIARTRDYTSSLTHPNHKSLIRSPWTGIDCCHCSRIKLAAP
jgi:hypothetical protein